MDYVNLDTSITRRTLSVRAMLEPRRQVHHELDAWWPSFGLQPLAPFGYRGVPTKWTLDPGPWIDAR